MIGRLIRNIREEKGITQQQVCDKVGIDVGHLSHIENEKRNPSNKTLKLICEALNIPMNQLLNFIGNELNEKDIGYEKYIICDKVPLIDIKGYVDIPEGLQGNISAILANQDIPKMKIKKGDTIYIQMNAILDDNENGIFLYNGKVVYGKIVYKKAYTEIHKFDGEILKIDIQDKNFNIIGKIV